MLTRRRARVAVRPELAHGALPPLPLPLVLSILLCLPPDQRLLAALVSRAFRAAVNDASLWRVVSLARGSGVAAVSVGLLRALSLKAAGGLVELDVSDQTDLDDAPLPAASIRAVCASSAASLRRLRLHFDAGDDLPPDDRLYCKLEEVDGPLAAAPLLASLDADVACGPDAATRMLLNAPPYGPLRVRRLGVNSPWAGGASVAALSRAAAAHPTLRSLHLAGAPLGGAAAAVAVAAAAAGLSCLVLSGCDLGPAPAALLAALLRGGGRGLVELAVQHARGGGVVGGGAAPLAADAAAAAGLCAALRCAPALRSLTLAFVRLWAAPDGAMGGWAGGAAVAALVGHPTLASLSLEGNPPWGGDEGGGEGAAASRRAAGEALARLVAAAAAAPGRGGSPLRRLRLALCLLGDAGLRPVVAALRGCAAAAGLADLDIGFNAVSRGFAAGELLPAVAANASLRRLEVGVEAPDTQAPLDQAAALVAARAAAAAGGA